MVGVGFASASPAAAAPQNENLDAARARVDRLSQLADTASQRHRDASTTLGQARSRAKRLSAGIAQQRRTIARLQTQVADLATEGSDSVGGTSVGATPLTKDSKTLLATVTVVTEDTDGRTQRMAASSIRVSDLTQRRAAVRERLDRLRSEEKTAAVRESTATAKVTEASGVVDRLQQKADEAAQAASAKQQPAAAPAVSGGSAVDFAMAQVGKAYVYGAAGPSSFDCSGLTMAAWATKGVSLPHNSTAQYSSGRQVSESELAPGDLVFYYSPISHVGMYIGNGKIVSALNPSTGIQVSGLHDMPYVGAVRPD